MSSSQESALQSVPLTFEQFFDGVRGLGPLRVISISGPSVFESICELGAYSIRDSWLNAITPAYHWHLRLDGVGHLTSRDQIHERSGRRVLFFELREQADAEPFLFIYLHREKGEEFDEAREARFAELHAVLHDGISMRNDP